MKLFHVCLVLHSCKKYLTKAKVWGNSFAGFGFSSLPSVCENKISLDWFASLNSGLNLFYQGSLQHLEMTHPACNMYQLKPNSVLQPRMYISNEINYIFFLLTTKNQFIKKKKVNNIIHLKELRYLPNSSHTKKYLGPAVKMPSCSAWSPFSFNQYFSSLKLQRKQLLEKHWETIGSRRGPFLQKPDVCSSVSSKSGLRVNFLAVICRRAASTSCCILEHENHYFNPSLPDINRMNKCFCSLLNLDGFIQMAMKTSKYPSQLSSR